MPQFFIDEAIQSAESTDEHSFIQDEVYSNVPGSKKKKQVKIIERNKKSLILKEVEKNSIVHMVKTESPLRNQGIVESSQETTS